MDEGDMQRHQRRLEQLAEAEREREAAAERERQRREQESNDQNGK